MKDYHLLGSTGLRVSPLTLGVMTFGQDDWGSDEATSRAIFHRYLEAGGNSIDTANVYADGRSEELTGKFIRESGVRDQVVLGTKFGNVAEPGNPNAVGNGRKTIISALDDSLRRLQTDHVDIYWLHIWDKITPVAEVMATFDTLVRSGKVRAVGLSNVPAWYAAKAQTLARSRNWEPVAALQMEYSLIQREIEREHFPAASDLDLGIIPWSPLAHGFLSGKYRRSGDDLSGPGRLEAPFMKSLREAIGGHGEHDWKVLDVLATIAAELDRPVPQVALSWVAHRPGVVSTLIGVRTPEQLEDNLAAWDLRLAPEHVARLDEASAPEPVHPYLMFDDALLKHYLTPDMDIRRIPTGNQAA